MKKIISLALLTVLLAVGMVAVAEEGEAPLVPELPEIASVGTVVGTITEFRSFYGPDGEVVNDRVFILVATAEGGVANLTVKKENCEVYGKPLEEAAVGDSITATFDSSLPMTMIYPPQYTVLSVTIG